MKITILGSGASYGVPVVGCSCKTCKSNNPKNKRKRVSVLVESATTKILIDTPPDLKQQAIDNDITSISAVIYTHDHADHLHGIDDLRIFNQLQGGILDIYGDEKTLSKIREKFPYIFRVPQQFNNIWLKPSLNQITINPPEKFVIGDIEIQPFWQEHGPNRTLGFRFGNFAYSTDVNGLSEEAMQILAGVDTWVVDCLGYRKALTHAHLEMTLGWIDQLKPRVSYLTHMSHDFDYDALASELPENVFPAFDGLVVSC
ncbi:MAG: MBL fold metallo-hydrolase [Pseudomonadota bacterium]